MARPSVGIVRTVIFIVPTIIIFVIKPTVLMFADNPHPQKYSSCVPPPDFGIPSF